MQSEKDSWQHKECFGRKDRKKDNDEETELILTALKTRTALCQFPVEVIPLLTIDRHYSPTVSAPPRAGFFIAC